MRKKRVIQQALISHGGHRGRRGIEEEGNTGARKNKKMNHGGAEKDK